MKVNLAMTKRPRGKISEESKKKVKEVLYKSMVMIQTTAVEEAPADTGTLRSRISVEPNEIGHLVYTVTANVEYASAIEFGTEPHKVGGSQLKTWARRNLGDEEAAYAVAWKIRQEGTEEKPFMRPAREKVINVYLDRIANQVAR